MPRHVFPKGNKFGGRHPDDLKQFWLDHSPAAAAKILSLVNDEDPAIALKAATTIIERAYGKPIQKTEEVGDQKYRDIVIVAPGAKDENRKVIIDQDMPLR